MKIMGLVTYAAHNWRDTMCTQDSTKCDHVYQCPCKEKLLKKRTLDRLFISEPIRRPIKIDGKFNEYSVKDRETLVKVGLHISTILCADQNSTPAVPRNMTNYKRSKLRINQAFCRAYSGRLLRFNAVLQPARHSIAWIKVKSPVL